MRSGSPILGKLHIGVCGYIWVYMWVITVFDELCVGIFAMTTFQCENPCGSATCAAGALGTLSKCLNSGGQRGTHPPGGVVEIIFLKYSPSIWNIYIYYKYI